MKIPKNFFRFNFDQSKTSLLLASLLLLVLSFSFSGCGKEETTADPTLEGEEAAVEEVESEETQQYAEGEQQEVSLEELKEMTDGEYQMEEIDTSDWKTYRNEEMGFEVKIPVDLEAVDNFYEDEEGLHKSIYFLKNNDCTEGEGGECAIYVFVREKEGDNDLIDLALGRKNNYPDTKIWSLNISGEKAISVKSFFGFETSFYNNSEAWNINVLWGNEDLIEAYPGILQTFKLID